MLEVQKEHLYCQINGSVFDRSEEHETTQLEYTDVCSTTMCEYCCTSPIAILIILVIISSIVMIRHIYKADNASHGAGAMFRYIGMCNVSLCIFAPIYSIVEKAHAPNSIQWFASTASVIANFLHLGFNVSLAYERLQVIKHPMEYFSAEVKKKLERKLSLIVITSSLIIGFSCSTLRFIFKNISFKFIPLAASRILAYITLCVLYFKLYVAIKEQNQEVAPQSNETGQPTNNNNNNEMMARRKKQLEHAKRFFIGITSSYFVLNLPTMITFFLVEEWPVCNTIKGILFTTSNAFLLFNMLFDTMWYFYMDRRARRSS